MGSQWLVQYWAFFWKILLQRARAPWTTVAELLLPCVFTLLLALGYWKSSTTHVPPTNYAADPLMNFSAFLPAFFCQNITHPHPFGTELPIAPCQPHSNTTACFPFVRDGALCVRDSGVTAKSMFAVYYASGPVVIPTFDAYLALSAFTTYESRKLDPTFFSRSGRASLSHYGRLLLVSDGKDLSIPREFAKFCASQSALCGEVIEKDHIFTSMEDAQEYARRNDGEVWAIAELPTPPDAYASPSVSSTERVAVQGGIFTISMNFTATPWTFDSIMRFSKGLGGNSYMLYVNSGFLTLQNMIQQFYAHYRLKTGVSTLDSGANPDGIFQYASLYGPSLVPMPSPPYIKNSFYEKWAYFMPLVAVLAAIFPVARLVNWVVEEKFLRIRESMHIMGLRWSCMAFGWFTSSVATDVVASTLTSLVFRFSFFSSVNYGVLFLLYFSFLQQNSALSLFLSAFFTNPRVGGAVAALVIFLCSIPFFSFPDGMSVAWLTAVSIVPCVAYSKAFNQLVTYASFGYLFSWENLHDGEYSVALAIGMMWASTSIMLLLWMYFDQVLPSSIGRRRHPFFFLSSLRRCFGCFQRSKQSLLPLRRTSSDYGAPFTSHQSLDQPKPLAAEEKSKSHAVVFHSLCKIYNMGGIIGWLYHFITGLRREGDRSVAVQDVSFTLDFGTINVLLGPNGSGKSTLMGIATGMVKPTSGDVYICGYNAACDLAKARSHIGYCPQADIVWEELTVKQHLTFYARMKSDGVWCVQQQVKNIISSLQLEDKRDTRAGNLSGGQRRRLCVGIALIGQPAVLFLDEPTAGMDLRGRRAVYDVLQSGRETRAVMISTHLLDEADRVGDQILLMQDGMLRGAGSSLFLKSKMGVGYIVTCVVDSCLSEMEESVYISRLTELVRAKAYVGHHNVPSNLQLIPPQCKLLGIERRGREISFRFPLSLLSSAGSNIIRELEKKRNELHLRSIGLSLTTLQDVMDTLTTRQKSSTVNPRRRKGDDMSEREAGIAIGIDEDRRQEPFLGSAINCDDDAYNDNENDNNPNCLGDGLRKQQSNFSRHAQSFTSHFAALFMKRVHCAKRDKRLLVFQVLLPVAFLAVALLIDLVNPPSQPAVTLDASIYPGYNTQPYSVVTWTSSSKLPDVFGLKGSNMAAALGPYYTPHEVSCELTNCSIPLSSSMIPDIINHSSTRNIALSFVNEDGKDRVPTSIVMHNASSPHAAGQALNALYSVVSHQLFGEGTMMTARNEPMQMGPHEEKMIGATRRVISGIFILLPFTFIPSNTVSFMVREKQSGSRHLQWLAGANVLAFWLSSMLFDFCCFLITEMFAMLVFIIFKRTEFIGDFQTTAASIALFTAFGLSSIPFSYVISFFFNSPFVAQNVVLIANFVFGFLWVMGEQIIGSVESLVDFMLYTTYILRVIPSVSFGEGMFTLSGVELGNLMMPGRPQPNLFGLLHFVNGSFVGGIGTGLIYMSCTFVLSLLVLVGLEFVRVQRVTFFCSRMRWFGKKRSGARMSDGISNIEGNDIQEVDQSVVREEAEVCQHETGRAVDCITLQHVTKRYSGTNVAAVNDISLGVQKGEIMVLLGLNGAGKTTAVGILAGEVVPTSGSAFINHLSALSSASRSYVGYCPQKDAILDHLSPYEHLMLYARLRGTTEAYKRKEIPRLLSTLGLEKLQNKPAHVLSGGNKRRLSLAVALVGGTTSVLLDEPTAGMDAVARRQTCAVVKRLTKNKSVILTTHLLDETEALADRVSFISRGRLQCVGTPQELKTRYSGDAVYTVCVVFAAGEVLLDQDDSIREKLCELFSTNGDASEKQRCTIESIVGRVVTLSVRKSLSSICTITADIREGRVKGLPPVVQVSATQPTLDDMLLSD